MMATSKKKRTAPTKEDTTSKDENADANSNKKPRYPPFCRHFKTSTDENATLYKVGDTKQWDGSTWYFCDCPNHKDKLRWHSHKPEVCRTRKRWLAEKDEAVANNAEAEEVASTITQETAPSTVAPNDTKSLSAMLADALSVSGNHSVASELIAEALDSIEHS